MHFPKLLLQRVSTLCTQNFKDHWPALQVVCNFLGHFMNKHWLHSIFYLLIYKIVDFLEIPFLTHGALISALIHVVVHCCIKSLDHFDGFNKNATLATNSCDFYDFALLSRNFVVIIYALFPQNFEDKLRRLSRF